MNHDDLSYHNAAGASEALTEERENDLRIALDLSHEEVQADVWISDTICTIALNWPGSIDAAVTQYEDALREEQLAEFINENRAELVDIIHRTVPNMPLDQIDDDEIEDWIINDEGLYNWALSEGVEL